MTSNRPQTALVSTPQSKNNPSDVKVEEIPLPPSEMWEELDNSGKAKGKAEAEATAAKVDTGDQSTTKPPQAKLNFRAASLKSVITLHYPFHHPSTGEVEEVTIRRLTVGEVGDLLDQLDPKARDNFDIYAVMTGLPADVLRGLIDVDGEEVSRVCYNFLPRIFRPQANAPS